MQITQISCEQEGKQKTVTVLGSTGSIGTNTLDLLASQTENFSVISLVAGRNIDLLVKQAKQFQPRFVALADETLYQPLKKALSGTGIDCGAGDAAVMEAVSYSVDITVSAIVGFAGLRPTMKALEHGNNIALANKECLVCAGDYMMRAAQKKSCTLLPVDSEHNAIFQVLDRAEPETVKRLILTASGGPFLHKKRKDLTCITPEQAVAHPNWSMGAKISVDSATMMNKALEVIEAHYLFGKPSAEIDILVHPQSVVHSMVEYIDGSILAQMGASDMRTPIASALAWPTRMPTTGSFLDITKRMTLEFLPPDTSRFPMLALVRDVLDLGGALPTVFNSANEVAVDAFLKGGLSFLGIEAVVDQIVHDAVSHTYDIGSLDDIFAIDEEIRKMTLEKISKHATNVGLENNK